MKKFSLFLLIISCITLIGCQDNESVEISEHIIELTNDRISQVPGRKIDLLNYLIQAQYDIRANLSFEIYQDNKLILSESIEKNLMSEEEVIFGFEMDSTLDDDRVYFTMNFSEEKRTITFDNFIKSSESSDGNIVNTRYGTSNIDPIIEFTYQVNDSTGNTEMWRFELKISEL